jgi:hypothetical protein
VAATSIRFQCPNCKSIRAVNMRLLGRKTQCPECGQDIQIPDEAEFERQRESRIQAREEARQKSLAAKVVPAEQLVTDSEPVDEDPEFEARERMTREERELAAAETNFLRPRPKTSQDMDMTPMVDVTFLLLIFFMVTASFSVQKSIQRPAQKAEDPSVNVVHGLLI